MHAYHLTAPRIDALRPVEVDTPRPGHGEVLVRLRAASLNYVDVAVATGGLPVPHLPLVPGTDGAGEIADIGPGVENWRQGDRVIPHFLPDWLDGALPPVATRRMRGVNMPGSLAEYVVLPANALIRMPDGFSFAEAATLPIAATTAWRAVQAGGVAPGSTVLTLGTGGVSLFALQLAKASGARVIVTSSSDEKLERARRLGADGTINYRATPNWADRVLELTAGRGVDLVVENGGAATFAQSLAAVAVGGTIFVVGFVTGADMAFSLYPLILKMVRVLGSNTGSVADLAAVARAIETTGIRPMVDRTFAFPQAAEAYDMLASGRHFGKLAITL